MTDANEPVTFDWLVSIGGRAIVTRDDGPAVQFADAHSQPVLTVGLGPAPFVALLGAWDDGDEQGDYWPDDIWSRGQVRHILAARLGEPA